MKKSKLRKIEKKRKMERQRRRQKPEPLAYHGNKYKIDELVQVVFHTEAGVYESFVISDRKITDHDVRRALEWLIRGIRGGTIDAISHPQPNEDAENEPEESLIVWNVRRHWGEYFAKMPFPGRDNLIGVLRTILGSVETWGNISPTSRGYLRYLEGFMSKLGVHCQQISPDFAAALEDGTADFEDLPDGDDDENELLLAGRAWSQDANTDARTVFLALADELISAGQSAEVAETCQQLIGETADRRAIDELGALSIHAQQHLSPTRSPWRSIKSRLIGG